MRSRSPKCVYGSSFWVLARLYHPSNVSLLSPRKCITILQVHSENDPNCHTPRTVSWNGMPHAVNFCAHVGRFLRTGEDTAQHTYVKHRLCRCLLDVAVSLTIKRASNIQREHGRCDPADQVAVGRCATGISEQGYWLTSSHHQRSDQAIWQRLHRATASHDEEAKRVHYAHFVCPAFDTRGCTYISGDISKRLNRSNERQHPN